MAKRVAVLFVNIVLHVVKKYHISYISLLIKIEYFFFTSVKLFYTYSPMVGLQLSIQRVLNYNKFVFFQHLILRRPVSRLYRFRLLLAIFQVPACPKTVLPKPTHLALCCSNVLQLSTNHCTLASEKLC